MPQLCFYFQLHQPYRLRDFSLFDLSHNTEYFSDREPDGNKAIFQKVAAKSYLPMLTLLNELVARHSEFKFALSCSGIFLDQALAYEPQVVKLLQQLASTGQVEFLAETYYHSLAGLYSEKEFTAQVAQHSDLMGELFEIKPQVFRNTELIYSNEVSLRVAKLGFKAQLTEAVDRYLHGRDRTQLFVNHTHKLPLLLKHAQLSDDIAFRFSDKNWHAHPLTVEKYLEWVEIYPEHHLVNLFMDFETFGEHQWADTGIFQFFEALVQKFLERPWNTFVTPSQVIEKLQTAKRKLNDLPVYNVPLPISWADVDRDLTAWTENALQKDTLRIIYEMEKPILASKNKALIEDWRKLQTSDHFYYMCTKWAADGDVHAYFSPYKSPFEAYRRFSVVLADVKSRLTQRQVTKHSRSTFKLS
ncbi:MAG TPA: glycoside hydrolase family 57 protein [Vitreimonas sp.]|nr:glycoside hydrolase family 57 protein [Vitreimonas sp.]